MKSGRAAAQATRPLNPVSGWPERGDWSFKAWLRPAGELGEWTWSLAAALARRVKPGCACRPSEVGEIWPRGPSAKCPSRILAKKLKTKSEKPWFSHLRILAAKPYLRIRAKACESLRNYICERLRNLSISAKAYLRKLAKIHAFCICESLRNTICGNLIAKLCEKCIYC